MGKYLNKFQKRALREIRKYPGYEYIQLQRRWFLAKGEDKIIPPFLVNHATLAVLKEHGLLRQLAPAHFILTKKGEIYKV